MGELPWLFNPLVAAPQTLPHGSPVQPAVEVGSWRALRRVFLNPVPEPEEMQSESKAISPDEAQDWANGLLAFCTACLDFLGEVQRKEVLLNRRNWTRLSELRILTAYCVRRMCMTELVDQGSVSRISGFFARGDAELGGPFVPVGRGDSTMPMPRMLLILSDSTLVIGTGNAMRKTPNAAFANRIRPWLAEAMPHYHDIKASISKVGS